MPRGVADFFVVPQMLARTLFIIIGYNDIFLRKDLVQWKRLFIFADKS